MCEFGEEAVRSGSSGVTTRPVSEFIDVAGRFGLADGVFGRDRFGEGATATRCGASWRVSLRAIFRARG